MSKAVLAADARIWPSPVVPGEDRRHALRWPDSGIRGASHALTATKATTGVRRERRVAAKTGWLLQATFPYDETQLRCGGGQGLTPLGNALRLASAIMNEGKQ
jgi:hypothetical protein